MLKNKRTRTSDEINAGSMADIAFLLLIFFLVTTTISAEKGIMAKLPPYDDDPPQHVPVNTRNILSVKVNKDDLLLVKGKELSIGELKDFAYGFIMNYGKDDNLSEKPKKAIVSLQNDRSTSYEAYISVYNEIKAAYNQAWNEQAEKRFNDEYENLTIPQKKEIQKEIPLVISEAEPTEI